MGGTRLHLLVCVHRPARRVQHQREPRRHFPVHRLDRQVVQPGGGEDLCVAASHATTACRVKLLPTRLSDNQVVVSVVSEMARHATAVRVVASRACWSSTDLSALTASPETAFRFVSMTSIAELAAALANTAAVAATARITRLPFASASAPSRSSASRGYGRSGREGRENAAVLVRGCRS